MKVLWLNAGACMDIDINQLTEAELIDLNHRLSSHFDS